MSFFNFGRDTCVCWEWVVSILVLVDVFLQPAVALTTSSRILGFNPCFSGCLSSTIIAWNTRQSTECFNPCFSGCLSSTHINLSAHVNLVSFNPCFSGCLSSTLVHARFHTFWFFGFNPCFSGCLSSTQTVSWSTFSATKMFQSLF